MRAWQWDGECGPGVPGLENSQAEHEQLNLRLIRRIT